MIVAFTVGFSIMLILRLVPHSREALVFPRQALSQWHRDRARVFRVCPDSSAMLLALSPLFWAMVIPDLLAVPKASEAARQHPRTPPVLPRSPTRCVKPVLLVFLMEQFSANVPV